MGKHYKKVGKSKKKNKMLLLAIFRLVCFIMLIISSIYIINWYIDSRQNKKMEEKISETVVVNNEENTENKYTINFNELKEINSDVVAWVKVNGTEIEYPVVQAKDNSYYLKRNLEKKNNVGGWIFADYKNKLDGTDKNIVVYGHNMKDNSMFGTLKNVLNENWYNNEENHIIEFVTEQEQAKYQVFSVYKIEKEEYYINTDFTYNEYETFIDTIEKRSVKDFGIEVTHIDNILTLSTCADNNKYRVVLHAKKINN